MKEFEKLDSMLFNEKIEQSEMSQMLGGASTGKVTKTTYKTYVTINTDVIECGEDYKGTYCGPVLDIG